MKKIAKKLTIFIILLVFVYSVYIVASDLGFINGNLVVTGTATVTGIADGGLTNYDLMIGDITTPDYGMMQFGNAVIGRTSYNAGAVDLDGAVIFRNLGGPVTSQIEFIWTESAGGTTRFALPKAGVGNATYNPRSFLVIGPSPNNDDMVTLAYWQGLGWFDNIDCDTAGTGADLGVMDDAEIEGDFYVDSIKESTSAAGVSLGDGGSTNYTNFAADGFIVLNGTARASIDIEFNVSELKLPASNFPAADTIGITPVFRFDASSDEEMFGVLEIPHEYSDGTDLLAHFHWAPFDGNAGNVTWGVEWHTTLPNNNEVLTEATTTQIVVDATESLQDETLLTGDITIDGTGIVSEMTWHFRIFRDADASEGGASDTYAADASLVHFDIEIMIDGFGKDVQW